MKTLAITIRDDVFLQLITGGEAEVVQKCTACNNVSGIRLS